MVFTRKQRTKIFRDQVEHEWKEKFWKFIEDNLDKPWSWRWLSQNPNITFDIVLAHPNKSWDWNGLSRNPNITFDIVLAHPEQPWDWYWLSLNPNITFDIVQSHPNKPWNWRNLSRNMFNNKARFIEKRYNEYLSAYRIQQCWNRAISIPTNPICQRQLKSDYEKYSGRLFC